MQPINHVLNSPGKKCGCSLCEYGRRVDEAVSRREPDELIEIINELMDSHINMSHDLDYLNAVFDGSWTSSVQQLEMALERAKNHPNRKLNE